MQIIRLLRIPPSFTNKHQLSFSSQKPQPYIPVRPLCQQSNILFRKGDPQSIPFFTRILIYTPSIALGLDGYLNQWEYWTIGGTALFMLAARYVLKMMSFFRTFEVYELRVSKDMSRFCLMLQHNRYSRQLQDAVLKLENKTFEEKFVQALKAKTHLMPEQYYNDLINSTPEQLKEQIQHLRSKRDGVIIDLDSKFIDKIQFVAKSQMYTALKQNYFEYIRSRPQRDDIFEGYTALKEKKEMMVLTTKKLKEWNNSSAYFIINVEQNQEKKLEEYLKALGQGKRIVIDI